MSALDAIDRSMARDADPELEYQIGCDAMVGAFARAGLQAILIAVRRHPNELRAALAPLLDEWTMLAERNAGLLAIQEDRMAANAATLERQGKEIERHGAALERLEIALAKARQNWGRLVTAGGKPETVQPVRRGPLTGRVLNTNGTASEHAKR